MVRIWNLQVRTQPDSLLPVLVPKGFLKHQVHAFLIDETRFDVLMLDLTAAKMFS